MLAAAGALVRASPLPGSTPPIPLAAPRAPYALRAAAQDTIRRVRPKRRIEGRGLPARRAPGDTTRAAADTLRADSLEAVGPPFPEPDSVMQALMRLPGYRPVLYQGDTLNFSSRDRAIQILQRATVNRAGEKVSADTITYRGTTRWVTASGDVQLVDPEGKEVVSDEGPLYYDTSRRIGTVVNARTDWEVWKVSGNFTLEGSDTLWVRHGYFTSCELPEPHYRFESDKIKLVLGHIVVAWPVRLYFGDVPVFWFPFMAQDIRRGRHSGILTPRFGVNDIVRNSSGHNRHISNIGYYWAISDYLDAQLSLDWWSKTWTRFDGFFRYRWRRRFIDGRLGYSQFFLPHGGRETSATWIHSQKFGERSDLRASVRFVSSQQFQREAEFNPERLVQTIRSDVGFTRRFDWGTLNLSAQRVQPISEGEPTTTSLPQLAVTLSPIVITPAPSPLQARWYHGLTWTGSANFNRLTTDAPGQPGRENLTAGATSNLALGNLRWNSAASFQEQVVDTPDTVAVSADGTVGGFDSVTVVFGPEIRQGTLSWQTSLGYQQRLIGSTTLTPAVNVSGALFRSDRTNLNFVSAPTRVSLSAALNSDVFGFFPGIGPLERIRHKFSPRFNWIYSPGVTPSPELQDLPGFPAAAASKERHQLSVSLAQTFEGKFKPHKELKEQEAAGDSLESRQPPKARKLTLLAIRTTAVTYDFVEKRITTDRLSNTLTSDLLRGLTVRIDHDLFKELASGDRVFDPFLTQLNLTFSLGERTIAGLFGEPSMGISRERGILPETRGFGEGGLPGDTLAAPAREQRGAGGPSRPWNLSVDYSLVRTRPVPGQPPPPTRQSVRANLRFSPTRNWTLAWRTQYDLEQGDFVDHVLILRRDLHRWSATFEFLQASNGNFVFNFRVNLNDLPDLKFDYRQETR